MGIRLTVSKVLFPKQSALGPRGENPVADKSARAETSYSFNLTIHSKFVHKMNGCEISNNAAQLNVGFKGMVPYLSHLTTPDGGRRARDSLLRVLFSVSKHVLQWL